MNKAINKVKSALAVIVMMAMVSCSSQGEQVTVNKNSLNLSQKATAISMVVVEPVTKIDTFMVYRPHKVFSMPKIHLKPLPKSRHSNHGVMLLLNGMGYEHN